MTFESWLQNSWLVQHTTTTEEIVNLLGLSDRDLTACQVKPPLGRSSPVIE